MKRKGTKLFVIIIGSLLAVISIVLIGKKITKAFTSLDQADKEHLPSRFTISTMELDLISPRYRSLVAANKIYQFTDRNPIALLYFDKIYNLIAYKIDLNVEKSMQEILNIEVKEEKEPPDITFNVIDDDLYFRFLKKTGASRPVSSIYLSLAGDSIRNTILNDSTICYHLICSNLSVRFGQYEPVDIFVEGKKRLLGIQNDIPMDLMFLKRQGAVYQLLMTPHDRKGLIAPDLLYHIVEGV